MSADAVELSVSGRSVARYLTNPELADELSPRPYLHPVLTLAGVGVTDVRPGDHEWHLGVSVAIADVAGTNFWGGPTFVRDRGYEWHDDHGHVEHVGWLERTDTGVTQDLAWVGRGGDVLLRETRRLQAAPVGSLPGCWALTVHFALTNVSPTALSLGSPGSNGRDKAGYGGFFWRLPHSVPAMTLWSPDGAGEDAVLGRTADWVAAAGHSEDGRAWSVLLMPGDPVTARDPWFVRAVEYPSIGSALAFDQAIVLPPGGTESRRLIAAVADGTLSTADCAALHHELSPLPAGPVTG